MQRKLVARLSVTLVALMGLLLFALPSAGAATVEPTVVDGNPKCGDIASNLVSLTKFDNDPTGSLSQDGVSVTIDGTTIDWTSETPVYAVIVKGGDNSNVYLYDGGATSDSGLTTVTNPLNGQPYTVSHVEFCGDPSAGDSGGGSGDSGGGTVDGGGSGDSGGGTVDGGGSSDDGSGGTVDGGGSSGDNSGSNDNSGGTVDNSGGSNDNSGGTVNDPGSSNDSGSSVDDPAGSTSNTGGTRVLGERFTRGQLAKTGSQEVRFGGMALLMLAFGAMLRLAGTRTPAVVEVETDEQ